MILKSNMYFKWGETFLRIRKVTSEGFTFVNLDKETFVNFKECNENWVMYNKRKNNWTEDEVQAFRTKAFY